MKTTPIKKITLPALLLSIAAVTSASAATIISNDFDGVANDTGSDWVGGGWGGGADVNTGVVTLTDGSNNKRATLQTINTVDVSAADSFTMNWVISGGTHLVNENDGTGIWHQGFFFGVTNQNTGNANYNTGTTHFFGVSLAKGTWIEGVANSINHSNLGGGTPTPTTMEDGFTVSLTLHSDDTWEISTTGLSNDQTRTGAIGGRTSFSDLAPTLVAFTSIGGGGSSYTLDSATLSATGVPEPTTTALLGLGGLALILRRRR